MPTIAPWLAVPDLPSPLPTLPGGEADWLRHIQSASEVLWALSGRRWAGGPTIRTVEVVAAGSTDTIPGSWHPSWGVHVADGEVYNHGCCQRPTSIRLPGDPSRVLSVGEGTTTRDPATYRLNGRYLEDLSGRGWPTCHPGIAVRYEAGRVPPEAGRTAAGLLARELGRAQIGDPGCALPANVTSVVRQGLTQTLVPALTLFSAGRTGVPAVDLWLATVNPNGLRQRTRAWSPDTEPTVYVRPEETA